MSPRRPEPAPNFTQPPLLATVSELTPVSLDERAADIMAALDAAGLFGDQHQARALAAAGMLAPHAWAGPAHSDRRRAEAAAVVATIRQDVTRRRAAAAHARTRGGAS